MQIRRKIVQLGAAIAIVLMPQIAAGDNSGTAVCKDAQGVTLSGKIRALQSMREEPQAEVQTFFKLDLLEPICGGLKTVDASVIGLIPYVEGDTVTMTGDFSAPDTMFAMAFFRGHRANDIAPYRAGAASPKPD